MMTRMLFRTLVALCFASTMMAAQALSQETMGTEKGHHPRIAHAIQALEGAIQYMQAAPHDFGGHKAAAIQESEQALAQLRLALQYRAKGDNQKGK
jgi:hypothetical protein